jgi:hypothetical protein
MNISDYLKYEVILPAWHWSYPLWFGLFHKAPFTKASRADTSAGIAPDTAAELLFPEIPPLFLRHPL